MSRFIVVIASILLIGAAIIYFMDKDSPEHQQQQAESVAATPEVNELPALPLVRVDGARVMANTLKGKTVIVLFQPDCDHCQRQAVQMREHLHAFDAYEVYFVSNVSLATLSQFAKQYDLEGKYNVHFASTKLENILDTVGPVQAPSVFVYNENRQLVKSFIGETPIEEILVHL